MAKGITGTGEGFDAPSKSRLGAGGFGGHNPDMSQLRGKMVKVIGHNIAHVHNLPLSQVPSCRLHIHQNYASVAVPLVLGLPRLQKPGRRKAA